MPKQKAQQPAGDNIDQLTEEQGSFFKASLLLEEQRLDNKAKTRQMVLEEALRDPEEVESALLEITGLDLSIGEERALEAVQILLDQTNYEGNVGRDNAILISVAEYYEAYGLERKKRSDNRSRHSSRQHTLAMEDLRSLASKVKSLIFWENGKKNSRILRYTGTLINLTEITSTLQEEDYLSSNLNEIVDKRVSMLQIEPSEMILYCITSFFILKEKHLYNRIKAWYAEKRSARASITPAAMHFFSWLAMKNRSEVEIMEEKLIERLRLNTYREKVGWPKCRERLETIFQCAQDLGYLIEWRTGWAMLSSKRKYTFLLNPELNSRVRAAQKKQAAELPDRS